METIASAAIVFGMAHLKFDLHFVRPMDFFVVAKRRRQASRKDIQTCYRTRDWNSADAAKTAFKGAQL